MRAGQNNGRIASNWAGIRRSFHRTEECLGVYLKFVVSMILSFLPMCYIYYSNTTLSLSRQPGTGPTLAHAPSWPICDVGVRDVFRIAVVFRC
jgi:hypothetical protein